MNKEPSGRATNRKKYFCIALLEIVILYSASEALDYHKSKREVPRDVRNSKVREQDKFRRDWSIRTHASPKVGSIVQLH